MSMSSSVFSFSGVVSVIVISPKNFVGWFLEAFGLALSICLGSGNKGGEGSGGGCTWKFVAVVAAVEMAVEQGY